MELFCRWQALRQQNLAGFPYFLGGREDTNHAPCPSHSPPQGWLLWNISALWAGKEQDLALQLLWTLPRSPALPPLLISRPPGSRGGGSPRSWVWNSMASETVCSCSTGNCRHLLSLPPGTARTVRAPRAVPKARPSPWPSIPAESPLIPAKAPSSGQPQRSLQWGSINPLTQPSPPPFLSGASGEQNEEAKTI